MLPTKDQLNEALAASSTDDVKKYFGSLLRASKDHADDVSKLLGSVKDTLLQNEKCTTILVDLVWMQTSLHQPPQGEDADTSGGGDLAAIVKAIATALPELHIKFLESLDAMWLQIAGIVAKEADLNKKIRLTNTQQYYRQHKFNVMMEVSEGYAKWLYFVSQQAPEEKVEYIQDKIKLLIGTFSLDPSRCLDITLDVLEDYLSGVVALPTRDDPCPRLAAITTTIRALHTDKITAILAFKMQKSSDVKHLLRCVVYLFHNKLVDLIDMMTFFPEWFDPLQEMCKEYRKKERKRIRELGRIRLSSTVTETEVIEEKLDLSPIENHMTTQLVFAFLEWNLFADVERLFIECWGDLCQLFPEKVGNCICNWVQTEAQAFFARYWPAVRWHEEGDKVANSDAMEVDTPTAREESPAVVISSIGTRLAYTKESGCIALHPKLYCQLWRVVAHFLKANEAVDECTNLVEEFLLPALSSFTSNSAMSMEAWKAISIFPCRKRYELYAKWRGAGLERDALSGDKPLWLIEGEMVAGKAARYSLKRLAKDSMRERSRAIAKVSHSHPLVVFSIMLSTIEAYDNMVKVMVESMRFFAPLSLDVLCFCIINRLTGNMGGVNRSRLKEDGVNVSQWLQSLETFIGVLCRQFPSLEIESIISYLIMRLRKGEVMELGVLRAILKTAGGWAFADPVQAAELTPVQIEGRAGSALLKREIMSFGVFEDFSARASSSIRGALQSNRFGVTILVLLAQVHHQIIFGGQGKAKPIKLIGNLVDSCQATMAILLDFLADSAIERTVADGSPPEAVLNLANSMPALHDLIENFELDLSSVWMICRPLVRAASIQQKASDSGTGSKLSDFHISQQVREAYMSKLPEQTWQMITCDLYESFHCNTLFDIFLPDDSYKTEIARLEKEIDSKTKTASENTNRDLERMKKAMAELSSDWNKQRHHVESIRNEFKEKNDKFFVSDTVAAGAMSTFFTTCVFPRCMKGPDDALYCVHFISMLHTLETPGFGILQLYDLIIVSISRAIFGLTEKEAGNAAILLECIWKNVSRWRYDEECFGEELQGKVGSVVLGDGDKTEAVTSELYAALYNRWHASLGAAMLGCLQSSEYMHW